MSTNEARRRSFATKLGVIGLTLLFSGAWAGFLQGFRDWTTLVQLAIGIVGLAAFLWIYVPLAGEKFSGRGTFFVATSAVTTLVVIAALVGLNYIAVKKPKSWDLTREKIFTLSDQTVGALKGLKDSVTVQAFYSAGDPEYAELDQRLKQYKAQTDKLDVQFIDPLKHPTQAKEANISQSGPRVIVKSGSKEARAKDIAEEALTNALIEVTRGTTRKIYFTKGHGEHAVADNTERGMKLFVDSLKSDGYNTDEILLAEHREMPSDAMALVIAGPVASLSEGEVALVKDWVENKNGRVIAMIDPAITSGLEGTFAAWGLTLDKDEVIDADSQNPELAIAQSYATHPITEPRNSPFQLATIFPVARSVSKVDKTPAGWSVVELAKTGPRAWGETSPIREGSVEFNAGQDVKGPVTLAAALTKGESRVVVVGNSMFASNGFYRLSGNRDFALNSIAWAAHEEQRISIRPKQRQSNHLFLSADQKHTMTLFAFDLLPFSLLFAGLLVWQTRKSR